MLEYFNFNVGTAMKHLWRAGLKTPTLEGQLEDLKKAQQYNQHEIDRVTKLLEQEV